MLLPRTLVLCMLAILSWPREARADLDLSIGFSDSEFIAYFRQAILARTLPGHDDRPGRLARWSDPVRLVVIDATDGTETAAAPLLEQSELVTNQIRDATGLAIQMTTVSDDQALLQAMQAKDRPNLILMLGIVPFFDEFDAGLKRQLDLFVKPQQLITPCSGKQCRSAIMSLFAASKTISAGVIKIDPADAAFARAAIAEGLLRVFSDAAAVDAAYPSVLGWHRADPFDRPGLSRMDRMMLHMLYDPRLTPGMTSPEIDALLPALLADAKTAVPH